MSDTDTENSDTDSESTETTNEPDGVDVEERGIDPSEVLDGVDDGADAAPDEKPDPSDVDSLTRDDTVHQRDEDGVLIPESDVIKIEGEWHAVKHKPLTRGLLNRFDEHFGDGEDVDWEELDGMIADFYVEPDYDPDDFDDMDPTYYLPLLTYIVKKVQGDMDDDVTQQLEEEVEERQTDESGN